MRLGCGKPAWNGRLDDYCSKACRDCRACVRPGCGKPAWNGSPNEFCSRRCRNWGPPSVPVTASSPSAWKRGPEPVLLEILAPKVVQQFQDFIDATHKEPPNNWTRDRGCLKHGVGDPNCSLSCACANKVSVPVGYKVVQVEMNLNPVLWAEYIKARALIVKECKANNPSQPLRYADVPLETSAFSELGKECGAEPLSSGCNEWRLLHGTTRRACEGICESNFSVALAGSGATWKHAGEGKGMPLYGNGIYLAERITKADEYAKPEGPNKDHFCALVCRVVGGRSRVVTKNLNPGDVGSLQQDVASGACHSVVADRVTVLNKPFKEVVLYNTEQVLPEFIITYRRL